MGVIGKTDGNLLNSHHPKECLNSFSSFRRSTSPLWPCEHKPESRTPACLKSLPNTPVISFRFTCWGGFLRPEALVGSEQDHLHNLWGLVQNESADPLFKNNEEFQDGDSRALNRAQSSSEHVQVTCTASEWGSCSGYYSKPQAASRLGAKQVGLASLRPQAVKPRSKTTKEQRLCWKSSLSLWQQEQ